MADDTERIGEIGEVLISIDWETKTFDFEDDYHCIFIDFEDLEETIKLLEKIKIKIKEETENENRKD